MHTTRTTTHPRAFHPGPIVHSSRDNLRRLVAIDALNLVVAEVSPDHWLITDSATILRTAREAHATRRAASD